jgi:hypothetical protein
MGFSWTHGRHLARMGRGDALDEPDQAYRLRTSVAPVGAVV